jgi:hypothetical protein
VTAKSGHNFILNLLGVLSVFRQEQTGAIGFIKATETYSLTIIEKASISLTKSSKIIEIFIKVPHFLTEASISIKMASKSLVILIKTEINFKKPQILRKCILNAS